MIEGVLRGRRSRVPRGRGRERAVGSASAASTSARARRASRVREHGRRRTARAISGRSSEITGVSHASASNNRFDTKPHSCIVYQWSFSSTPTDEYTTGSSSLGRSAHDERGVDERLPPAAVDRGPEPAGDRVGDRGPEHVAALGHDRDVVGVLGVGAARAGSGWCRSPAASPRPACACAAQRRRRSGPTRRARGRRRRTPRW